MEDYDRALDLENNNPRFWHSKGLAYEGRADDESVSLAIQMYRNALERDPKYFGSRFHLGCMLHKANEFQEALQCFTAVIGEYAKDKEIFIKRG